MKPVTTTIPSYYLLIGAFLVIQAVLTVYHGGLTVTNTAKLTQLSHQKQQLSRQLNSLQQTLADNHSLLHIEGSDLYNQFQPIASVVHLNNSNSQAVASR